MHPPVLVTHNDIDYNQHMNNANYIRIACEYLPETYTYIQVRMEFKHPVRFKAVITAQTCLTNDSAFYVELIIGDALSTILEFK